MYNILNFIKWGLTHIVADSVPKSAELPIPANMCGTEPWHYLYGTVRAHPTKWLLDERYTNYYANQGWSRADYDAITQSWDPNSWTTDCQGLLDAYMTYVLEEKMDYNCEMNYKYLCTDKGPIGSITRDYVIGEALFMQNKSGKMSHIGWICGKLTGGDWLVLEARGIKYGVVITKLSDRAWTHRGLMTAKFDYSAVVPYKFYLTRPYLEGPECTSLQQTLNICGYRRPDGEMLTVDGVYGPITHAVFQQFIEANRIQEPQAEVVSTIELPKGAYTITVTK